MSAELHVGIGNANASVPDRAYVRNYIFDAVAEGWRVVQPLPVKRVRDGELYLVSDDIFSMYGEGSSWEDAERDLIASLADYYSIMAEAADEATRAVVEHLGVYLQPHRR